MHIASLVKIPCYLLKLLSGNKNMGMSRAGNSVKIWQNLPISNPKPDLHNINAHTKFGENPLMFTQVIIRKRKTDGRTYNGHTQVQRETIIPRHYCAAGYNKKGHNSHIIWFLSKVNQVMYSPAPVSSVSFKALAIYPSDFFESGGIKIPPAIS